MQPFTSDLVITNKIPWNYNSDAYNELADDTLNRLACNDPVIRMLLEEVIGYCFYRKNELGQAFMLTGDKANGKSTFISCIRTILGEANTSALDLKELGDRFSTSMIFGKLANLGDDIGDDFLQGSQVAVFKKIVTGDRIKAERKGQDPFEFNPYTKLLFSANDIPRMKDKTGAVLRRLVIIPFNTRFSKYLEDGVTIDPKFRPYIKYELNEQSSVEYMIKIGIEGLKRIIENNGFTKSKKFRNSWMNTKMRTTLLKHSLKIMALKVLKTKQQQMYINGIRYSVQIIICNLWVRLYSVSRSRKDFTLKLYPAE